MENKPSYKREYKSQSINKGVEAMEAHRIKVVEGLLF